MIGGIDIRLPSKAGIESVEVAVRAIRQLWPRAVIENGDTVERYGFFGQVPFGKARELFVYRDRRVAEIWEDKGAIPEVLNTMVHILYDDGLITAVIDERDAEMTAIIDAIRSGLDDSILYIPRSVAGLGVTRTPDMLLMAWRIVQGMVIKDIQMEYRRQDHFQIRVILESPYGDEDEHYESTVIQDFTLFRHVGIMEISGKPVFDGFYPLKVK